MIIQNFKKNTLTVFGTAFPPDGEMGPYPLSDTNLPPDGEMGPYPLSDTHLAPDGEMGPYPLSDNSNLLGPTSLSNLPLYRNYGSNYSTNYASNYDTSYMGQTQSNQCRSSTHRSGRSSNQGSRHPSRQHSRDRGGHCNVPNSGGGSGCGERNAAFQYGVNSPVPSRRAQERRDSFRRHSAHGRISSPSGTQRNCRILNSFLNYNYFFGI